MQSLLNNLDHILARIGNSNALGRDPMPTRLLMRIYAILCDSTMFSTVNFLIKYSGSFSYTFLTNKGCASFSVNHREN